MELLQGGAMMMAALTSSVNENTSRFIWLYDTFSGMPEPGDKDVNYRGDVAMNQWLAGRKDGYNQWCYANLETVQMNMASTCYPEKKIRFVKGMVGQTIPAEIPDKIALLRLDTDWYASTKHELENLYPLLCEGGVLIIDDWVSA